MPRRILLFLSALSLSISSISPAIAQDDAPDETPRFSFGAGIGTTDAWTDIGTKKNSDHFSNAYYWDHLQLMGNLYLRYRVSPSFTLRLSGGYGRLFASDQFNGEIANQNIGADNDAYQRYTRNLDFRTDLYEAGLLAEIKPFRWFGGSAANWGIQPVLMIGLAYFHFDPEASYPDPATGQPIWVKTRDLHLEGEGLPYKGAPAAYDLDQITLPIGLGLHCRLSPSVTLGIEYLYRKASTDYLDGVSNKYVDPIVFDEYLTPENAAVARQLYNKTSTIDPAVARRPGDPRGSPKANDAYSTFSLNLFISLKGYRTWYPVKY